MKKRKGSVPLLLGLALILCSLGLMLFFYVRLQVGSADCQKTATVLSQMLPDRAAGIPGSEPDTAMPVLQLEGTDYVALLEIPSLGITLPVADRWDSSLLSPARFFGSVYDHTLVIGGADDPRQFGFCDKIDTGVSLTVTDMTGAEFTYRVTRVDRSKSADTHWLSPQEHDLTLFCRDQFSTDYVAVRCEFAFE